MLVFILHYFNSQYAQTTMSLLDEALPRFFWKMKKSFCTKIKKKCGAWKEAGAGEGKGTKSGWMQLQGKTADGVYLVPSCSVRTFLATLGVFWVLGQPCFWLMAGRWKKSRWRIIAGLIASVLLTHPHLLRGDPWGFLLRSKEPVLSSAAVVWIWLMFHLWPSPLSTHPACASQFHIDLLAVAE